MTKEKLPDWNRDRYWGEIFLETCPSMYGQPIYYTDGSKIPYTLTVQKVASITAEGLAND